MHQHHNSPAITISPFTALVIAVALLATICALTGLLWPGGDGAYVTTTYRGQEVEIFGHGIYADSSTFGSGAARGTDLITLLFVVPLLGLSLLHIRRGSVRSFISLAGGLIWTTYVYSGMALGTVAYNPLFLVYVVLFGISAWSLVLLYTSIRSSTLFSLLHPDSSGNAPGNFLIAAGSVTAIIWLIEPVAGLIAGEYPDLLGVSTTLYTHGFDIAVILPAAIISGVLMRRGSSYGYLFGVPLIMLMALLAPAIVAQTFFQVTYGIEFSPAQIVVMIGGFLVMGAVAIWIVATTVRGIGSQQRLASKFPAAPAGPDASAGTSP
jgi:hypothetical protein